MSAPQHITPAASVAAANRGWTYEVHELSEGISAIVYDEHGSAIADHLSEERARLISAAPNLLVALEDFDNWFCGFNPENQASRMEGRKVVIRARAAIAKAVQS